MYVGGLPTWYYGMQQHAAADSRRQQQRPLLALPTALLEPRFRGAIKDLRYEDVVSRQVTVQDMVAYKVSLKLQTTVKSIHSVATFCSMP